MSRFHSILYDGCGYIVFLATKTKQARLLVCDVKRHLWPNLKTSPKSWRSRDRQNLDNFCLRPFESHEFKWKRAPLYDQSQTIHPNSVQIRSGISRPRTLSFTCEKVKVEANTRAATGVYQPYRIAGVGGVAQIPTRFKTLHAPKHVLRWRYWRARRTTAPKMIQACKMLAHFYPNEILVGYSK